MLGQATKTEHLIGFTTRRQCLARSGKLVQSSMSEFRELYRTKPFASAEERVAHVLELHQSREAGLLSGPRTLGRPR